MTDGLLVLCDRCESMIGIEMLDTHPNICVSMKKLIPKISKMPKIPKVPKTKIPKMTNITLGNLLPHQVEAVRWCSRKAKIYHKSVYPNVVIRFLSLGYTEQDISLCLDYLKNVDVITHFGRFDNHPVPWLKTETKLKNAFETTDTTEHASNTYLGQRLTWEDNIFNKIYTLDCPKESRVKYGCLNLFADPIGCSSAIGYGRSYMVFKNSIKDRITFVCGDSSAKQTHVCTFDNCVQLLLYFGEKTLENVIQLARMKKTGKPDTVAIKTIRKYRSYMYVEVQIHGDVVFDRDIDHIMLWDKHCDDETLDRLSLLKIPYTVFRDEDTHQYEPMFL